MHGDLHRSARQVIADLRELAALTSTPHGAQRLAWGPVWKKARGWLEDKVSPLGLKPVQDSASGRVLHADSDTALALD